jgi:serine/threonine protein kinase
MQLLDSSLPTDPKASGRKDAPLRDLPELASRTDGVTPTAQEPWDKLAVTRVVDPVTEVADFTPPSGIRPPTARPTVGSTLGDFELLEKLGEGAMGAVYRARQISFQRIVALKILFSHVASQPRLVERLYREARALAQLDHQNVVQAYGVGEEAGCHYVAMEYVEGNNLQNWLRRLGKLSVGDALAVTLAIARGLAHAHAQGFIHRDIKPENILISTGGHVKVADLGMVKADDEDMALTQTGHALGTPWYMPLEQARNAKDIDGRSDIYALGCLLYCLLTGHPPFQGRTIVELIQAKDRGTFPTARSQNPDVPERLDLIILKAIAKTPAARYQACAELIVDLERLDLAAAHLTFVGPGAVGDGQRNTPAPQATHTLADTADLDPNVWYVQIRRRSGKVAVKRLSTEQLQVLLDADQIKPNTPASHFTDKGFRALSTYKEFAAASAKATREGADEMTSKYRQLYKKIEAQEEERDGETNAQKPFLDPRTQFYLETAWAYGKIPLGILVVILFIVYVARVLT